ncbi:uncharacterized protein LOC113470084 [Diaphorina citri]|uniref:Uncharacterized protein LOC113470084 n=1 Tax=Diaphorina citri TaxID=121845 RepID=A0A3Q0JBF9_DIACI|nr:uncharacterized protein LOC113470084 [Diaphorina citri]
MAAVVFITALKRLVGGLSVGAAERLVGGLSVGAAERLVGGPSVGAEEASFAVKFVFPAFGELCVRDPELLTPDCDVLWGREPEPTTPACDMLWGRDPEPITSACDVLWGKGPELITPCALWGKGLVLISVYVFPLGSPVLSRATVKVATGGPRLVGVVVG